ASTTQHATGGARSEHQSGAKWGCHSHGAGHRGARPGLGGLDAGRACHPRRSAAARAGARRADRRRHADRRGPAADRARARVTQGRDPGLQPERTALAWRRTALALMIGPVAAARLLAPGSGVLAAAAAGGGLLIGICIAALATRRQRAVERVLAGVEDPVALPDALLLALTAAVLLLAGLFSLGLLLYAR
ncbi:DUF202 domain-containing protein, partial [Pengzhenrongella frigida]